MRKVILVMLITLGMVPRVSAAEFTIASLEEPVPLHGVWRFRTGDDVAWADPDYQHGRWDNILVPRDWRRSSSRS